MCTGLCKKSGARFRDARRNLSEKFSAIAGKGRVMGHNRARVPVTSSHDRTAAVVIENKNHDVSQGEHRPEGGFPHA